MGIEMSCQCFVDTNIHWDKFLVLQFQMNNSIPPDNLNTLPVRFLVDKSPRRIAFKNNYNIRKQKYIKNQERTDCIAEPSRQKYPSSHIKLK